MTQNRHNRESETREKKVHKKAWVRPETLPTPTPEAGYKYHWVRISTLGQADTGNVSAKLREGWEPVRADAHPEILSDEATDGRFKDNIIQGGLMLCKATVEMVEERNAYYSNQAASQIHSVDNSLMRENDPRMPLFNDRKTKVTFGKG
jgi:hypothetical protein